MGKPQQSALYDTAVPLCYSSGKYVCYIMSHTYLDESGRDRDWETFHSAAAGMRPCLCR